LERVMKARSVCMWFAGALLILAGSAVGKDKPAAPPEVPVIQAMAREVIDYEDFTGHLVAVQSVEIRPRLTGMLDKVTFQAGAAVKKGDLLFQIDPRPFQAALDKADADLHLAEAHVKRMSAELDRFKELLKRGAVSREEYD